MKKLVWVLGAAMLLMSGCATMNESECVTADWYLIGFEDGRQGHNESRIGVYRQDCAKHGISPTIDSYRKGHYEGSIQFCTASNGYSHGFNGHSYNQSCPADLEDQFLLGYRDGRTLFSMRQEIETVRAEINSAYQVIADNEILYEEKRELLIADGVPPAKRISLLAEMEDLKDENESIQAEIIFLENKFADMEDAFHKRRVQLDTYN